MVHLADGAYLLFDRVSQPVCGVWGVDLDVFHIHARGEDYYRRSAAAGMAGAAECGAGGWVGAEDRGSGLASLRELGSWRALAKNGRGQLEENYPSGAKQGAEKGLNCR